MFLYLEMCHLEWDIPKRKMCRLEWGGGSNIKRNMHENNNKIEDYQDARDSKHQMQGSTSYKKYCYLSIVKRKKKPRQQFFPWEKTNVTL